MPRATSSWSLVSSRQTAAAAVGGERRERRQRGRQPPRRLERDHGLGRAEHPLELAGAARQEALEAPAVGGQPGGDQRGGHRRGARAAPRPRGPLDAGADQAVTGVGDHRRAGVGDQHHLRPALDLRDELAGALGLVLLVVGDEPRAAQIEPLVQAARAAGVLAGDQVGLLERPRARAG